MTCPLCNALHCCDCWPEPKCPACDSRLMREAARPGTGLDPKDESGGARSAIAQTTEPAQPFNPWLDRLQDGEKPPEPLPEDAAFEAAIVEARAVTAPMSKRARKRQTAALLKGGAILLPADERRAVLTPDQQQRFAEFDRQIHAALERAAASARRTLEWIGESK